MSKRTLCRCTVVKVLKVELNFILSAVVLNSTAVQYSTFLTFRVTHKNYRRACLLAEYPLVPMSRIVLASLIAYRVLATT
jgi:hypothetical protein